MMLLGLCTLPLALAFGAESEAPPKLSLLARSAIVIDAASGVSLWEKQADLKSYPASTTKILTALLCLESLRPEQMLTADEECAKIEASSLYLKPGEQISAQDATYAIMLRSANDASYLVAKRLGGSVEGFARKMNDRLALLGCSNTHFTSPNGLHRDDHYTTARDMAKIAREALKNPDFRAISSQRRAVIARSINNKDTLLISKNSFLDDDQTYTGVKTGYTKKAGSCFVGSASRDGRELITVVFSSPDWKADQKLLMDFAFANSTLMPVAARGDKVGRVPVSAGTKFDVEVELTENVERPVAAGFAPKVYSKYLADKNLQAPITKGDPVGFWLYSDGKGWSVQVPVIASEDCPRPFVASSSASWATPAIGGCALGLVVWLRSKSKRWATEVAR